MREALVEAQMREALVESARSPGYFPFSMR